MKNLEKKLRKMREHCVAIEARVRVLIRLAREQEKAWELVACELQRQAKLLDGFGDHVIKND